MRDACCFSLRGDRVATRKSSVLHLFFFYQHNLYQIDLMGQRCNDCFG
jgi:hypothetical protein